MIEKRLDDSIKIRLPSTLEAIDDVVHEVRSFLKKHELAKDDLFAFDLAIREGLVNAVKHGNQARADLTVGFELTITPKEMKIHIEDQGEGFSWKTQYEEVEIPVEQETGRGLILIRQCGFRLSHNEKGNVLQITRSLG